MKRSTFIFLSLTASILAGNHRYSIADEQCFNALTQSERADATERATRRLEAIKTCDTPAHRQVRELQDRIFRCRKGNFAADLANVQECEISVYTWNQRREYPGPVLEDQLRSKAWVINDIQCPVGCSDYTRKVIGDRKGQVVRFGPTSVENPLYEACPKPARFHLKVALLSDYLHALPSEANRAPATPASLGLKDHQVHAGFFTCPDKSLGENTIGQVIVLDSRHLLLVYEDDAFVQLNAQE